MHCQTCGANPTAGARYCAACGCALGAAGTRVHAHGRIVDRRRHAPAEAAYFRKLLEELPIGAFVAALRPESRLLYVTPCVAVSLGIPPDEFAADPACWRRLVHPDDRSAVLSAVERLVVSGEALRLDCRVVRPDGELRWWHTRALAVEEQGGPAAYVVGYCEDVTERRRDEDTLREARQREGRLEGVTFAARDLAHIVNNDLALGLTALDLVRARGQLPADLAELVEDAATRLTHAAEHLDKLQRVVRIETRDTPVGPALDVERSIQR